MNKRSKKPLIALVLLLLVGVVGGTLAYFTSDATFENIFKTSTYSIEFEENFESPDNWIPGTTTSKTVVATNTGNVDVAARVSYTETWVAADGTELPLTMENSSDRVAIINFVENSGWIAVGDYYYYNQILAKDAKTTSFISGVTFNENVVIDSTGENATSNCTTTTTDTGSKVVCTSSNTGYAGATYTLTIKVETIQADAVEEAWGVTIADSKVEAAA